MRLNKRLAELPLHERLLEVRPRAERRRVQLTKEEQTMFRRVASSWNGGSAPAKFRHDDLLFEYVRCGCAARADVAIDLLVEMIYVGRVPGPGQGRGYSRFEEGQFPWQLYDYEHGSPFYMAGPPHEADWSAYESRLIAKGLDPHGR